MKKVSVFFSLEVTILFVLVFITHYLLREISDIEFLSNIVINPLFYKGEDSDTKLERQLLLVVSKRIRGIMDFECIEK